MIELVITWILWFVLGATAAYIVVSIMEHLNGRDQT